MKAAITEGGPIASNPLVVLVAPWGVCTCADETSPWGPHRAECRSSRWVVACVDQPGLFAPVPLSQLEPAEGEVDDFDPERVQQELVRDARRWRSLLACPRIRFVGGAKLDTPFAHTCFDFHRVFPDVPNDEESRALLLRFVDQGVR